MQSAEIELKFPLVDPAALQARLPGLGFRLLTARTFEQNTLYDTPARTLRESRQILRLRQYGSLWTVTHKREPDDNDPNSRYKVRIETESTVTDGTALAEIFLRLGYAPVFRYEKFRTEWDHPGHGHLVIDETPIGTYGELEGPTDWIDATLALLRIDPATSLTDSYGKLFLIWKQRTSSDAANLTYAEIPSP